MAELDDDRASADELTSEVSRQPHKILRGTYAKLLKAIGVVCSDDIDYAQLETDNFARAYALQAFHDREQTMRADEVRLNFRRLLEDVDLARRNHQLRIVKGMLMCTR